MDKLTELKNELTDTRRRMGGLCWQSNTYRNLRDYERGLIRDIAKLEKVDGREDQAHAG